MSPSSPSRAARRPRGLPPIWRIAPRPARWLGLSVLALALLGSSARAQENEDCLGCHDIEGLSMLRDGREVSLQVRPDEFEASVHGSMDCVMCHGDLFGVEEYPHEQDLERVDCTQCHDDENVEAWRQSTHGRFAAEGDPLAPLCQDCHGSHYVIPLDEPDSSISPFNIPAMCAQCHAEDSEVERAHDLPEEQVFERYKDSIHGEGLYKQGLSVTAVCTSCHTGHNVLPHEDPNSTIHQDNVPGTCMQCHGQIERVHRKVIAGALWEEEGVVPLCVECHSPHEARKVFYDTKMADADCLHCHSEPGLLAADGRDMFVDAQEHGGSTHGRNGVSCAQCHSGASPSVERSCETITSQVDCSVCHEAAVTDFERGMHGALRAKGDDTAPYCTDCHGTHGILEHAIPEDAPLLLRERIRGSPTYRRNVPDLCAGCHSEGGDAARRILGEEHEIVAHYNMSIHGRGLLESGLTVTAICTDCHTAHKELPPDDPESTVSKLQIADTCGQCHDGIYEQYRLSIHSEAGNPDYVQLRGMSPLPHCNDCHSSHEMVRTDVDDFKLGIMTQCGKCHEEITESYFDTYHGKASALGDTTKAKCYDCHGAHEILPTSDPNSTLSHDNIVETCGACHEGSHRQFAGYLTHATHHDPDKYPILYYVFLGMTALLVGTFSFFGIHTIAWLPRSWKLRKQHLAELEAIPTKERQFLRFTRLQRATHLTVILSFFGLAITGMMLKFSYTGWAQVLSRIMGGAGVAGWIHRLCAVVTFGYFFLHLWDVTRRFRRSGKSLRSFFLGPDSLVPRWIDVVQFFQTIKWFLGRGKAPHYGRWTYWEKFDYFAVFWGVAVIGSTGLCLWFPELFTRVLPGWSINVATIIHSDEALLATGFIFTIHFFNTHFRPEKFPMDPVIFTGRMRQKELKHDRPEEYARLLASGELESRLVEPATPLYSKVVRIFGFSALAVGFTLIALIVYAMVFAYR